MRKFIRYLSRYINLNDTEQYELLLTEWPGKLSTQHRHVVIIKCNELLKIWTQLNVIFSVFKQVTQVDTILYLFRTQCRVWQSFNTLELRWSAAAVPGWMAVVSNNTALLISVLPFSLIRDTGISANRYCTWEGIVLQGSVEWLTGVTL